MSLAQTAARAASLTDFVGRVAAFGDKALPNAKLVAEFVPGLGPAIPLIELAQPIIDRIANAAPGIAKAIEDGAPIFDAVDKSGPSVLFDLRTLYALAANADPTVASTNLSAADIKPGPVLADFVSHLSLGRPMKRTEEEAWFKRQNPV